MPRVNGAILAGGESSRFGGRPKGLELVDGARMIDCVASALVAATRELLLVANDPAASAWLPGVHLVRDITAGAGPLGGIQAALHAASAAVIVVAWDMPFVTAPLIVELARRGEAGGCIVVPEAEPGRAEPACAYYPQACRDALDGFLASGERKPSRFLDAWERIERIGPAELASFGDPRRLLLSVNSAEELRAVNAN